MATSTLTKFQRLTQDLARGVHNWTPSTGHTLKVYLTNSTPSVSADLVKADLPESVSTGGGYTAGGVTVTINAASVQTSGTFKLILNDPPVWTGTGAGFGPVRYFVLYNDTPVGDPLIGYWDFGSSISIGDGETLTLDLDNTNGVIQFT